MSKIFQIISLLHSPHVVHPEHHLSPVAQHGQVLQLVIHRSIIVPPSVHHPLAWHNHSSPLETCVRNSGDGGVRSVAAEAWRNGDWLAFLIPGKYEDRTGGVGEGVTTPDTVMSTQD